MGTSASKIKSLFPKSIKQGLIAFGFGILLFVFILLLVITIFHGVYRNRIFPGVHVDNFPVGGMTITEAAVELTQFYQFTGNGEVPLYYLDQKISASPKDLGLSLDAVETARKAFRFGRGFPLFDFFWQQAFIFTANINISPVVIFDQTTAAEYLQGVSMQFDIPMKEAQLVISGTRVNAVSGQVGRSLEMEASLKSIENAARNYFSAPVLLTVAQANPLLLDANPYLSQAQEVLEQDFILNAPQLDGSDKSAWRIKPETLAPMLTFVRDNTGEALIPQFHDTYLQSLLDSIAEEANKAPQNPRFIFNDDTRQLDLAVGGIDGYELVLGDSAKNVQGALKSGAHSAEIQFDFKAPAVSDTASGVELGITELVLQESSYFYGSDTARIQNIEAAASEFHGLLIPPGETFSMASAMDDISLDNGYAEALIIYNGRTIEGIGGGVCQVSTTLFRAAFFAGFPIEERHPHAYRVSYYEKTYGNKRDSDLAGLDATVYIPLVDLKFTNDTPNWLLMETYVNRSASRITWKFYSTKDGRNVQWLTSGPTNVVEAKKPLYELNEDLDKGEIKQVDWEADGADVSVSRSVYRGGALLFEDSYFTRYAPWRAVYEYGPGTEDIPKE